MHEVQKYQCGSCPRITCTKVGCKTLAAGRAGCAVEGPPKQPQDAVGVPPVTATRRRGCGFRNSCFGVRPNSIICTRSASRIVGSVSRSRCCSALRRVHNTASALASATFPCLYRAYMNGPALSGTTTT